MRILYRQVWRLQGGNNNEVTVYPDGNDDECGGQCDIGDATEFLDPKNYHGQEYSNKICKDERPVEFLKKGYGSILRHVFENHTIL